MGRPRTIPRAGLAAAAVVLGTEAAFLTLTDPLTGMPVFQPTVDDATLTVKRRMLPASAGGRARRRQFLHDGTAARRTPV